MVRLQKACTTQDPSGSATDDAANQLLVVTPPSGDPTTHTWDRNGNLHVENCGGALTTYTWDDDNRLVGVSHPDGRVETHTYDPASGLRRKKETPEAGRIFVWQGQNVLVETDLDLVVQAEYTDLPGMWGGLVSQKRGDVSSFFGFDLQSSTRLLVSVAGVVTDSESYKAFGESLASSGATENPYRYVGEQGYQWDEDDHYYVRDRYPDVGYGRWLSRDPIWPQGGANPYPYVDNDPVNRRDPSGRDWRDDLRAELRRRVAQASQPLPGWLGGTLEVLGGMGVPGATGLKSSRALYTQTLSVFLESFDEVDWTAYRHRCVRANIPYQLGSDGKPLAPTGYAVDPASGNAVPWTGKGTPPGGWVQRQLAGYRIQDFFLRCIEAGVSPVRATLHTGSPSSAHAPVTDAAAGRRLGVRFIKQLPGAYCGAASTVQVIQYFTGLTLSQRDRFFPRVASSRVKGEHWVSALPSGPRIAHCLDDLRTQGHWARPDIAYTPNYRDLGGRTGTREGVDQLARSIMAGFPVVVLTKAWGHHIFVLTGYDPSREQFYANDTMTRPYGGRIPEGIDTVRTGSGGRRVRLTAGNLRRLLQAQNVSRVAVYVDPAHPVYVRPAGLGRICDAKRGHSRSLQEW